MCAAYLCLLQYYRLRAVVKLDDCGLSLGARRSCNLTGLGLDHEHVTFYHNGLERRLTNVHGHVVKEVKAHVILVKRMLRLSVPVQAVVDNLNVSVLGSSQ